MLESGQSIADYQIVKPRAENPVYQTYLVNHPAGGPARLILISSGQFPDSKSRQHFFDQAGKFLGQSFPGVCALLAADSAEQGYFCLYQEPTGKALADQWQAPFSLRRALELGRKIAVSLDMLHSSGLCHGHLSPTTIYLENDLPVLVDFALPSLVKLDFHSSLDPRYCCPELVRGESFGAPADIYSLGILLYRLLVGTEPFAGDDPFVVALRHVQGEVPALPAGLAVCQPLIDAMLAGLPEERWSAGQVAGYLEQLLVLPDIDRPLSAPVRAAATDQGESAEGVAESAMTTLIETRLKERAEIFAEAAPASGKATGARPDQLERNLKKPRLRQEISWGRSLFLLGLGVLIGVIMYLLFLETGAPPGRMTGSALPAAVARELAAGDRLLEQRDFSRAEQLFSTLVNDFPDLPQPYNNLAAVHAAQGDYEQARTLLERALATDANFATVYRNLGAIYAEMARDSYGKALQLETGQQPLQLQVFTAAGAKALPVGGPAPEPGRAPEVARPDVSSPATGAPLQAGTPAESVRPEPASATGAEGAPELPEVTLSPEPETPETFLQRWAAAWAAQDVDAYLAFYSADFAPENDQSLDLWIKSRRERIARPASIQVALHDFSRLSRAGELLQLELIQDYQSDRYRDRTRKKFDLKQSNGSWEILRERSLGRVR